MNTNDATDHPTNPPGDDPETVDAIDPRTPEPQFTITPSAWTAIALGVGMFAIGLLIGSPVPILAGAAIGVWLLSRFLLFLRVARTQAATLTVEQVPVGRWLRTNETSQVRLTATRPTASRLSGQLTGGLPLTGDPDSRFELSLEPDTTEATTTVEVTWPVAGEHRFRQATLTLRDGLFEHQLPIGETPSVVVEPRGPRTIHVGEGGQRFTAAYGEHAAGKQGSGIEPAEIREYQPGDSLSAVDWSATARFGSPHVREFEAETDRKTVLLVDHRRALDQGPREETKLAYLREVALAIGDSARRLGDPLGLVTLDDRGITGQIEPATTQETYSGVRRRLLGLHALDPGEAPQEQTHESLLASRYAPQTRADLTRTLAHLTDEDRFTSNVRPFFADRDHYVQQFDDKPLVSAAREILTRQQGEVFTIICTDDSQPAELTETVQFASREGGTVLVLLTPTVLFEAGGLGDLETAYDRYVEFEEFRRELARIDGVTALEVGPGDRLESVLAAGQTRRERGVAR